MTPVRGDRLYLLNTTVVRRGVGNSLGTPKFLKCVGQFERADKTIRVSEQTWRELRNWKHEGESFDDVITRELGDGDLLAGFGAWNDTEIDEAVRKVKQELNEDFEHGV